MAWQYPPQCPSHPSFAGTYAPGCGDAFRGFRDSVVYKIMSIADLSILDVADHSTVAGSQIITWSDADQENQKFIAKMIGSGFRLTPLEQGPEEHMSLDFNCEAKTLIIWNTHDGLNQLFNCQEIFAGTFLIRSVRNNYCLRNNGPNFLDIQQIEEKNCCKAMPLIGTFRWEGKKAKNGNQVTLVPKDLKDVFQHWRLIPTN